MMRLKGYLFIVQGLALCGCLADDLSNALLPSLAGTDSPAPGGEQTSGGSDINVDGSAGTQSRLTTGGAIEMPALIAGEPESTETPSNGGDASSTGGSSGQLESPTAGDASDAPAASGNDNTASDSASGGATEINTDSSLGAGGNQDEQSAAGEDNESSQSGGRELQRPEINFCALDNGGCDPAATCSNGPEGAICTCNEGFAGDGVICFDIDECSRGNGGCQQLCTNTAPGFRCSCENGFGLNEDGRTCGPVESCADLNGGCQQECTDTIDGPNCACEAGFILNDDGRSCSDINECARNNGGCEQMCNNTSPGFACACDLGFSLNDDGLTCADVNECARENGGCAQTCMNETPGFRCTCEDGFALAPDNLSCTRASSCADLNGGCAQRCADSADGVSCSCDEGYDLNADGRSCSDIDECTVENGGCEQRCVNEEPGYRCACNDGFGLSEDGTSCVRLSSCADLNGGCEQNCQGSAAGPICSCNAGYELDANGQTCSDINECLRDASGCQQLCRNLPGSYQCGCNDGYTLNDDDQTCMDIDECTRNNGGCEQRCINEAPGFRCDCGQGLALNADGRTCSVTESCAEGNGGCQQECTDTSEGPTCRCYDGFTLDVDGRNCSDIDECDRENGGCEQICNNTQGASICTCETGYALNADGQTCTDLDECSRGNGGCEQICINTAPGYECRCARGFNLDSNGMDCIEQLEGEASLCDNTCEYSFDGVCDDGGSGSRFDDCLLGSDCADCGPRVGEAPERLCGEGPACDESESCIDGVCVCVPDCNGRQCGDDGCGGSCGDCDLGNAEYRIRIAGGRQLEQNRTGQISSLDAPPGICDNSCPQSFDGRCDDGGFGSFSVSCELGTDCADCGGRAGDDEPQGWTEVGRVTVGACVPRCKTGQECGNDGCGGECGSGCNGDQACAEGICVGTGDVRITLTWQTNADLDLIVTSPIGEDIFFNNRNGQSGGILDVDAHALCETNLEDEPGVENIFWPQGTAPTGDYRVRVMHYDGCGDAVTPYSVTTVRNGRAEAFTGVFENTVNEEIREIQTFELSDEVCVPDCGSNERPRICGSDGCGGSCGICREGQQCLTGICAGLGDLAVSLEWDTEHDLDLRVVAPNGTVLDWSNMGPNANVANPCPFRAEGLASPCSNTACVIDSGSVDCQAVIQRYCATNPGDPACAIGQLDVDSHRACTGSIDENRQATPGVENVFWPTGEAPDGEYIIYVSNWNNCNYQPEQLVCSEQFICE